MGHWRVLAASGAFLVLFLSVQYAWFTFASGLERLKMHVGESPGLRFCGVGLGKALGLVL